MAVLRRINFWIPDQVDGSAYFFVHYGSAFAPQTPTMKLAFTIDFEDWYQGIGLPFGQWRRMEKRLPIGHYKLLSLLSKANVKATYFILGKTIEDHPQLIAEIISEGHEIACHSYSHPFINHLSPEAFRQDLQRCRRLIENFGIRFTGFRAPYFSITAQNWWAMDIIQQEDFVYDSSIFSGDAKRTGIPGFPPTIQTLSNGLIEFPIPSVKVLGYDFGIGGGYFRLLPYRFFKEKMEQILLQRHSIFYVHPWELDVHQPKVPFINGRIRFTHYVNLYSTAQKLKQLLSDFDCTSVAAILKHL